MSASGNLIVLSGPSGVGKSTLLKKVFEKFPGMRFSVSCTTRSPREGEVDGVSYYFISHDEFEERSQRGEFIEEAKVFSNRYGTLKSEVLKHIRAGVDVVLDIDVQGALQIRSAAAADPELARCAAFVMIVPPSFKELEERLRGRASETPEQLALRISGAAGELARFRVYDYIVVNQDLDRAAGELTALFSALHLRTSLVAEGEEPWLKN